MGKWNSRSRFQRRRSPLRWYSDRHSPSTSGYGEDDKIPLWEKKFCEEIGSVPWQKVVEASQFKSWYQGNVITWNDSACEETFHNEKKRFWSQVHGRHCDISLPDPDLYISEVDWNTYIEPELIRDLERAYFAPPNDEKIGFKRGRRDKNSSGYNLTPVEECQEETRVLDIPWRGSDKVHDVYEWEKKPNDWKIVESSTEYPKDRVRTWEAKGSCGNEKANDTSKRWESEECREIQGANNTWENSGHGNDGWDNSEHQSKKVKGWERVPAEESEMLDNPWEANPSCRKETAKDSTWGGSSGKGWEDRGWGNDCWGNQATGRKEWGYKRYNHDFQEPKGYNPWKGGFVRDNAASRDYGANAGGWGTRRGRGSESNQRNWDVKRSDGGWGKGNREREDLYSYNSHYRNSRPRRDDHHNRNVNFSAK